MNAAQSAFVLFSGNQCFCISSYFVAESGACMVQFCALLLRASRELKVLAINRSSRNTLMLLR